MAQAEDTFDMGDDGTGHCRGCGCSLDQFNEACPVCCVALYQILGWTDEDQ